MGMRATDTPGGSKVTILQNLLVLHFTLPLPLGHVMLVRCEQPFDEFTIEVWLLITIQT